MAAPETERAPRPRFAAILIVEPEPLLREILVSGLRLHNPRFAPHAMPDPEAALAWLSCGDVDLVIQISSPRAIRGRLRNIRTRVLTIAAGRH